MIRLAMMAAMVLAAVPASAQDAQVVKSAVLRVDLANKLPPISRLDLAPENMGFDGALLAIDDNQTTGRFMGQDFVNENVLVPVATLEAAPQAAVAEMERLIADGVGFIVSMADAETTLAMADAAGDRALIINAIAPEDSLRNEECRANMLHVAPSRAMTTDALAQFLLWKKWTDWFLIYGSHPDDIELAEAYRRTARKFGAKIVEERVFEDTGGARRTDTGHVQVQKAIPVFTQRAEGHQVVVAADETGYFAAYLPYQTWDPRPVVGSAGLRAVTWHPAQEAWGAPQFQNRFEDLAGRYMRPEDYQVWLSLRVLGEAATRTQSTEYQVLKDFILGPEFEVAGFKGQKLTFRPWDGQLRQPILLTGPRVLVSVSPQEEFIHQVTRLDTLGTDQPETGCQIER